MLSKKHLLDVCMVNKGYKECRYLHQDDSDYDKYCCLKLRADVKKKVDEGVSDHLKDCRKKGLDPALQGDPCGDNCSGYLFLKFVEQGYDKDKG